MPHESAKSREVVKIHFDAESAYGRPRTACGATAQRTREHAKVTCLQCQATGVFKRGPRVEILGTVVPAEELAALRAIAVAVRNHRDGADFASRTFDALNKLEALKGSKEK